MAAAAAALPYPRPLPPPRLPTVLGVLAGTAIAWLAAFALVAVSARVDRSRHDPASRLWYVALHGEGAPELYQLALARWEAILPSGPQRPPLDRRLEGSRSRRRSRQSVSSLTSRLHRGLLPAGKETHDRRPHLNNNNRVGTSGAR